MIFISLINNIALLVSISILYSFIVRKWYYETRTHQIISGFLFGMVTIAGMLNPFSWTNGIIFDGRSIIISVSGFFGGPLTALITASIASIFRVYLGGSGVYMGLMVIAGSAVIGMVFYNLRIKNDKYNKPLYMYIFGLTVHIYMLLATVALPSKYTAEALYLISIPVIVLYPVGSLLVCILFQDLISKINTEIALKKSVTNYRELVEDVNSLVIRLDASFNITFINNYAKKILFPGRDNYTGENFITRILSLSRFGKNDHLQDIVLSQDESAPFFETEIETSHGEIYFISWGLNLIYNDKGDIQEILCVGADITELKKSESALNKTKEYLEFILDKTNSSVFENDFESGEVSASFGLFKYLGYSPEDVPNNLEKLSFYVHPDDIIQLTDGINRHKAKTSDFFVEFRMRTKQNEWIWCNSYGKVIEFSGKSRIKRVIGIATQINERKQSEQERLRLQHLESLGLLAGGIAHDFNNILTVIMGKSSLAAIKVKEDEIKKMLESITDATVRAKGLTQQLLTFAKGGSPEKRLLDIQKVITETANFSISGSNICAEYNFSHHFSIEADPGQIAQVIQNIVINAVQAMDQGGVIKISTSDIILDDKSYIKISIKDQGPGIPTESIEKIFDPYFSTKSTGSGLGLSVCHSIIKRHDGIIKVFSNRGEGTTFEIYLPTTKKENADEIKEVINEIKALNVLVMDDNNEILGLLEGLLTHLGHNVTLVHNGYEAIEKVQERISSNLKQFDLAILDFTIRGSKGGLETAVEIEKIDPNIKKIISSGYLDSTIREKVKNESIEIFDKPYTIEKLQKKLSLLFTN